MVKVDASCSKLDMQNSFFCGYVTVLLYYVLWEYYCVGGTVTPKLAIT